MYRYLIEKAMACENWESYEFWNDKYNIEWIKIYGNKKEMEYSNVYKIYYKSLIINRI